MITSISIENVKGYGSPAVTHNVKLQNNRINLLIAPNGFGKSSLATAFEALRDNDFVLSDEDKHEPGGGIPKLTIEMDDIEYTATAGQNTISPALSCYVIHNRLGVHAKASRWQKRTQIHSHLKVEPITICKQVKEAHFALLRKEDKEIFGSKNRILTGTLNILNNHAFVASLKELRFVFPLFVNQIGRRKMIKEILDYINGLQCTAAWLKSNYNPQIFEKIEGDECYQKFSDILCRYFGAYDKLQKFLIFYQLMVICNKDHKGFSEACDYASYTAVKKQFDSSIAMLDTTTRGIHAEEENGYLKVIFPKAKTISNGQRDILTFIIDLLRFRTTINVDKPSLLIIDEIFDYLDDANTLAAQYMLSDILKDFNRNIYLVLLTHLSPNNFRSYVFSNKILNVQYLKQCNICIKEDMKRFIAFRQKLDRSNPEQENLYNNISHHLLHYAPGEIDLESDFSKFNVAGLKTKWGKKVVFHNYLIEQVNNYLKNEQYDPYAVAVALRLRTEFVIYNQLSSLELKQHFETEKETKKKLEYAEDCGVTVPLPVYAVSAIHNEADHISADANGNILDTPMVYKLEHVVIKKIIEKLFEYDGNVLTSDCLGN